MGSDLVLPLIFGVMCGSVMLNHTPNRVAQGNVALLFVPLYRLVGCLRPVEV